MVVERTHLRRSETVPRFEVITNGVPDESSHPVVRLVGTITGRGITPHALVSFDDGEHLVVRLNSQLPGIGRVRWIAPNELVMMGELKVGKDCVGRFPERTIRLDGSDVHRQVSVVERSSRKLSHSGSFWDGGVDRVEKYFEGGVQKGFKFEGVHPGSLLAHIGIVDGDAVLAVNGYATDSPEAAMAAYGSLRDEERVVVDLIRAGHAVRLQVWLP